MPTWCRYWTLVVAILASLVYLMGDPPAGGPTIAFAILFWSGGTLLVLGLRATVRSCARLWRFSVPILNRSSRYLGNKSDQWNNKLDTPWFWVPVGLFGAWAFYEQRSDFIQYYSELLASLPVSVVIGLKIAGWVFGAWLLLVLIQLASIELRDRRFVRTKDYPFVRRIGEHEGWNFRDVQLVVEAARRTAAPENAVRPVVLRPGSILRRPELRWETTDDITDQWLRRALDLDQKE